ncbi:alpha/beta fold hydrolase [Bacterioplanes sanyensis]|nr:alpha/beta hydrolase [Bacterioplanes sanyensis]
MLTRWLVMAALLLLAGCSSLGIADRPLDELQQRYSNERSQYLTIGALNIHYRDEGKRDGPVILMLHGVASSLHTWDGWVQALAPHYRLVRIDLPAHGLTGPDPDRERYDIDYMVEVLREFTQQLQLPRFVLAGNSLGGYISWNYALAHPQQVDKLILLDAAGYPQDMPFIMSLASWPLVGEMSQWFMPRFIVGMNVREAYGDSDKVTAELVRRYHDLSLRPGNRQGLTAVFRTMKEQSSNEQLGDRVAEVTTPTLLMWGALDDWVPLSVMERFAADLPDVDVIVYDGVGHMPMEEIPARSAADAHRFIQAASIAAE